MKPRGDAAHACMHTLTYSGKHGDFVTHLMLALLAMLASITFAATSALAHGSSDAYLHLEHDAAGATSLRVDVALRDLDRVIAVDGDDDRAVTWGEVKRAWPSIRQHVGAAITLHAKTRTCSLVDGGEPELVEHGGAMHAVLRHGVRCPDGARPDAITYRLFVATDAGHRGLMSMPSFDEAKSAPSDAATVTVLTPSDTPVPLASVAPSAATSGGSGILHFMYEGIAHIASGADHLLFLVTLIVVAVFTRQDGRWTVRSSRREIAADTLRIVTAFTLTHSLTLGLAAAGVVAPSSRWVESLIAASVLVAAIDNLRPVTRMPRWTLAGLFGFVHGFGFAGPLQELGLRGSDLVVPLLGFNLGVEAGQLALVALLLPLLLTWRHAPRYRTTFVPALSIGVGLLASAWLVERGLGVELGLPL